MSNKKAPKYSLPNPVSSLSDVFESPNSLWEPLQPSIKKQKSKIQTDDKSSHKEIKMMRTDFDSLKRKVFLLKYDTGIDLKSILIGAIIPELINWAITKELLHGIAIGICILIIFFIPYTRGTPLSKYIATSNSQDNSLHLNDIQTLISEIDTRKDNQ